MVQYKNFDKGNNTDGFLLGRPMSPKSLVEKKVLLFVINTLGEGGAAKVLTFIANHCIRGFKKIIILTFWGECITPLDKRITYIGLGLKGHSGPFSRLLYRFQLVRLIRQNVRELQPDLVCAFISDVIVTTRLALMFSGVPLIGAERGDPFSQRTIWKVLTKVSYSNCDAMVFQTKKAMDFYGERIKSKSVVLPNPYVSPPYQSCTVPQKNTTIIAGAGRFVHEKGFDVLIRAFKIVNKERPNSQLIIYGEGPLRPFYLKIIAELDLTGKVKLPGYVSKLPLKLKGVSVFVLSSRLEGIPNVLIEAMSMGVPTVSTDCSSGGPSFLTKDGQRGLLIPIDDENAMAQCILKLLTNKGLAQRLSQEGLKVKEELNEALIGGKWETLFNNLVS